MHRDLHLSLCEAEHLYSRQKMSHHAHSHPYHGWLKLHQQSPSLPGDPCSNPWRRSWPLQRCLSHWDHCQNVDLFPNAKLYVHQKEIEYADNPRNNDWATPKYFNKTIENHNVSIITQETEIEPGIQIIETPGHTRGHISVVVSTNDGNTVIAGDSLTDAFSLQRGTPGLIFWSKKEASESVEKIRKIASVVYPGHDRPFTIKPNGEIEYKEGPTSVTFTGGFENSESGFSATLNLEKTRVPWVHEEA